MVARAKKKYGEQPYFVYYKKGLIAKAFGALAFCMIYAFYYGGGDTTNYFKGVTAILAVLKDSPLNFIKLLFLPTGWEINSMFFNVGEFPPMYMLRDERTMTVIKITSIFGVFGLGGFLSTTLLLSLFTYSWVWKLYVFMAERYPNNMKALNISVLYLPSSIFWASGIMKDTFTFGATCYAVYGLHKIFVLRQEILKSLLQLSLALYLIITIKSYIMFALLPGLLIFANFERLKKIKSVFVKVIVVPISIGVMFFIANTLFFDFDDLFGKYSADTLLEEAAVQNADLQRSVYGSNSFDIGTFEPTLNGALSKFFPAVNAAIFRPYIWEVGSPTMLFSGIENSILILIAIWVILTKPIATLKAIKNDPFLIFCLLFTLILGFGVGLSTSNFGALVRYKIPFLPFFVFLALSQIIKKDAKTQL